MFTPCLLYRLTPHAIRQGDREQQKDRGRKERGRGESENRREWVRERERASERASGSTATRDLTPVTTLAMVNYYIDPFTSKATGGYTHTHTLLHIFTNTITDARHTPITVTQNKDSVLTMQQHTNWLLTLL